MEADDGGSTHWRREHAPPLDPRVDALCFQQIELDNYLEKSGE